MLNPKIFIKRLLDTNVTFFTGIPDSLLSGFCAELVESIDDRHHVVAANEGNAIALAVGHHMGTGEVPCVYLQNSGIGNTINPLISLADPSVYSFPMLLLIGWRGEPGVFDEPQHVCQGELTIPLLDTLGVPHFTMPQDEDDAATTVADAVELAESENRPVAILIKKGTFPSVVNNQEQKAKDSTSFRLAGLCGADQGRRTRDKGRRTRDKGRRTRDKGQRTTSKEQISRERAIELIVESLSEKDVIVSTTGKASRELYEIREKRGESHDTDFLVVGSMGHASQIAAGVALAKPEKRIVCLDGDGAMLMHMGALAINGSLKSRNFRHIILNNGTHDSVGGMPTVGLNMSVAKMADACGYNSVVSVCDENELTKSLPSFMSQDGPSLMNVIVKTGSRKDLGRPGIPPNICKEKFMEQLKR